MPAEWESHSRCWIAWPVREDLWGERIDAAREAYAEAARAISQFEPVTVIADPEHVADVSLLCGDGIGCLPMDHDDSWLRDTGPTFVADGAGNVAGVNWVFNGWGERYTPYDRDAAMASALLERLDIPAYESTLVLEGGAIHTDGDGTLLTTESVIFDPNRNGGRQRDEVEAELRELLGIETVIWLGEGLQDDDTGGHVDNLACFARPGVVLALTSKDPDDGNYAVLQDNLDRLRAATDARGRKLEVIQIEQPAARKGDDGQRLALSYINFYLANGAVIVPSFEDPKDDPAAQAIGKAFPNRKLLQMPALDIIHGGGGLHCITQQQPSGVVETG
ncbi:agmatine deiminase family protein [Ferruginivarius sediminum]|uniref:Agmatine deiminase family protein n=2 Tax=Ferruginivarius sediminum TaxID=2661937 RepID=A0A369TDI8_9PROT|nr:agmatine deiminase family protein [Ferruginivarius sediminum]